VRRGRVQAMSQRAPLNRQALRRCATLRVGVVLTTCMGRRRRRARQLAVQPAAGGRSAARCGACGSAVAGSQQHGHPCRRVPPQRSAAAPRAHTPSSSLAENAPNASQPLDLFPLFLTGKKARTSEHHLEGRVGHERLDRHGDRRNRLAARDYSGAGATATKRTRRCARLTSFAVPLAPKQVGTKMRLAYGVPSSRSDGRASCGNGAPRGELEDALRGALARARTNGLQGESCGKLRYTNADVLLGF
jgi:hypothetical protein